MIVIPSDDAVWFDVDNTLIMYKESSFTGSFISITNPYDADEHKVYPNLTHIKLLKCCKGKGKTVIVWSAAGHRWAECVVQNLDLENYVDVCMAKPAIYVDDRNITDFKAANQYIKGSYGN